jgi:hypothetical protein
MGWHSLGTRVGLSSRHVFRLRRVRLESRIVFPFLAALLLTIWIGGAIAPPAAERFPWWFAAIWSVITIVPAAIAIRRVDAACVIVDNDGVTVRNFRTTTHLPWDEIENIELTKGGHKHLILSTTDGRRIRPYEMSFGPKFSAGSIPLIAAELAAELESRKKPEEA